jgi:hypothetical protein
MKYLPILLLFASCNALTLLNDKTSSIDPGLDNFRNQNCPGGFIKVRGNSNFGTNDFCVMKFEAKNVSGVATSQENLTPWVNINQIDAKSACHNLGSNFDLISNPEWMTIARQVEFNPFNWLGGTVGSSCLFRGNNGVDSCGYDNSGLADFGSGRNFKSKFTLGDGQEIWDFAGNVEEWVDWTLGGSLDAGPTSCSGTVLDIDTASCAAMSISEYKPSVAAYTNATNGIGTYTGGGGSAGVGATIRGGAYNGGVNSGIYRLTHSSSPTSVTSTVGFRCVYRF